MNLSVDDNLLRRLTEAIERIAPPPPPQKGLHCHEITEKAISIRNTSKGKSLCQWTATEEPIPVTEVNAITGRFLSFKCKVKPRTERDGSTSEPEYLTVRMESSPTEVIVIRSNLHSNWSFQLLMALESLSQESLRDQFTISLLSNDVENYDPSVFCRLYHGGSEVKYQYRRELKGDSNYLVRLVKSLDSYLNPEMESNSAVEFPAILVDPPPGRQEAETLLPAEASVEQLILAEYARLNLMSDPVRGKALITQHFGEGASHASLTPAQRIQWLDILRSEQALPSTPEVVAETLDDLRTSEPVQPVVIPMGEMDAEAFASLVARIKARVTLLGLSQSETRTLLKSEFGKSSMNSLEEPEMVKYLGILNGMEGK